MKKTTVMIGAAALFATAFTALAQMLPPPDGSTYYHRSHPSYPPLPFKADPSAPATVITDNILLVDDVSLTSAAAMSPMTSSGATNMPPDPFSGDYATTSLWWSNGDWIPHITVPGWSALIFHGNPVHWNNNLPPCDWTNGPGGGSGGGNWTNTTPDMTNWYAVPPTDYSLFPISWRVYGSDTIAGPPLDWEGVYHLVLGSDVGYSLYVDVGYPFPLYSANCGPLGQFAYIGWDYTGHWFATCKDINFPAPGYTFCTWQAQTWGGGIMNIVPSNYSNPAGPFPPAYFNPGAPPWEPPPRHRPDIDPHQPFQAGLGNVKVGATYHVESRTGSGSWSTLTNVTITTNMLGTNFWDNNVAWIPMPFSTNAGDMTFFRFSGTNYTWHP